VRRLSQCGVTFAELIVALALSSIVAGGACLVLLVVDRTYRRSIARLDARQNLRVAAWALPPELRQLDPADSDLAALSPTAMAIRSFRELGFLCALSGPTSDGQWVATVREPVLFGSHSRFAAGDSALLFEEGDRSIGGDDRWGRTQITKTASGLCPGDSIPVSGLTAELHVTAGDSAIARRVSMGSPVRAFTMTSYALYQSPSDRRWYLGMRANGSAIEPLVGPLKGADGIAFTYFDSVGNPTLTGRAVAAVQIVIRSHEFDLQDGRPTYDSVSVRVALRGHHS